MLSLQASKQEFAISPRLVRSYRVLRSKTQYDILLAGRLPLARLTAGNQ